MLEMESKIRATLMQAGEDGSDSEDGDKMIE